MAEEVSMPPEGRGKNPNKLYASLIIAGVLVFLLGVVGWFFFEDSPFNTLVYALFSIAGILVLLALVFAIKLSRQKTAYEPDYYAFFTIGIVWIGTGIAIDMLPLSAMGLVFLTVGLVNKNKWKKTSWADLPPERKKFKLAALAILGLLLLALFLYALLR